MLEWTGERYVPWVEVGEIHYEHLHRYRFAKEFVKGKKVLDLACGEGYGSLMLSEEADEVTGIDIDQTTISHASSKYLRENLKFLKGSITDIPIKDEKIFDVIVCFEALEHIEEHDKLLREVKRLLKSDGIFIVSTPNKRIYADQPNYQNPFHLKELYFDEFMDLLSNNFQHVYFYGQKVYPSSNIFPLHKESGPSKDFAIEKGYKEFVFLPPEKKSAMYFIAVASDSNLGKNLVLGNSYLLDLSETLFRQKDAQISSLQRVSNQKDAQISSLERLAREEEAALNRIYASYGWKALLICYRITEKLLPPNSKRRMLAKLFLYFVMKTKSVLKGICYSITNKLLPPHSKRKMLVKLFLYSVTNTKSVLKGINKNNLRKFLKAYGTVEPSVLETELKRVLIGENIQPSKVMDASSYWTAPVEDELFANVEILKPCVERNGILVVDRFLPTHDRDAGSLRAFSIINILTKLGYRVTFLPDDLTNREPYASDLIRMGAAVLNGPLDVKEYLEDKGPEFSYVILSRPEQAYKYISLMRAYAINSKIIYDTVDLHWVRLERGYKTTGQDELLAQANSFKTIELLCASCSDMVLTVTSEEKEILLRENPGLKVEIIPTIHNITSKAIRPFRQRKDLMFIGGYSHKPNEDAVLYFIDEIFPLVKRALPEVRFFVIGSDPSDALLKRNTRDIVVPGYVKDVRPYFEDCRVFVAPLRYGAGMKGKIGQSMAYGLPVVSTGIGAEGIGLEDGISALIADDSKSFAEAVIRLYTDESLWRRCSEKAFEVIESNYTDEAIGKRITNILDSLKEEGI